MPAIRRSFGAIHGPMVRVCLLPELARAEMLRQANRAVPQQAHGLALIDTGAKISCVDVKAAAALFQQVGVSQAYTPSTGDGEPHMAEVFFGTVSFPGSELADRDQELLGMRLGYEVNGVPVLMLLGRDFLSQYTFTYDGPSNHYELRWQA